MALLLAGGLGPALIAQAFASIVQDRTSGKPWWRIRFNAAQYALSMSAAMIVMSALSAVSHIGSSHPFTSTELPALVVAAAALFVVNTGVVGVAVALHQEVPVWRYFRDNGWFVLVTVPGEGNSHTDAARYDERHDHNSPARLALTGALRTALETDGIVVWYQPELDLHTKQVPTLEALVRWAHPDLGLLAPAAFLEHTELTNLIKPLTERVLDVALHQVAEWRATGIDVSVAVNVSTRVLIDEDFTNMVAPDGNRSLHAVAHVSTYVLIGIFICANLRLPV